MSKSGWSNLPELEARLGSQSFDFSQVIGTKVDQANGYRMIVSIDTTDTIALLKLTLDIYDP